MTPHKMRIIDHTENGRVYRCDDCSREVVVLTDGPEVILDKGDVGYHESVEPTELPVEFAEFFAQKGWA